jgi:hypothetical protein
MPLFLLPFWMIAIGNAKHTKQQAEAAQQQTAIMQKQYELLLAEHNARYGDHVTVKKGILVHKGSKKAN